MRLIFIIVFSLQKRIFFPINCGYKYWYIKQKQNFRELSLKEPMAWIKRQKIQNFKHQQRRSRLKMLFNSKDSVFLHVLSRHGQGMSLLWSECSCPSHPQNSYIEIQMPYVIDINRWGLWKVLKQRGQGSHEWDQQFYKRGSREISSISII